MFRDNYTNFTFDDLRSENFKVWITNKNDLKRNMSPNFSDKFNTPTYGQVRYHEGTTIDKQDFKFSCVAVDVTLNEWRAITEWLSPLKSGKLTFDWNDKYYYMVKLSKAPSGTMFIKSKIDNVMGQLFIITFDLEFTTVYDWAALGPYCEQRMVTKKESENVYTEIDPSIYNNSYYIPQIIRGEKINTDDENSVLELNNGGTIFANNADEATVSTESGGATLYVTNSDFEMLYKLTYVLKYDPITHEESFSYKLFVDSSSDHIAEFQQDSVTLYLPSKNCYLLSISGDWSVILNRYNNLGFCNPGSYGAFPIIYAPGNLSIKEKGELLYKYNTNGVIVTQDIVIDNRQFTFTYGGRTIESVTDYTGKTIFSNIEINKALTIDSGRPELIKAIFISDIAWDGDEPGDEFGERADRRRASFLLNNKLIYDRYKSFIVHAFDKDFVSITNQFNNDPYSSKTYTATSFKNLILVDPVLKIKYVEEKGWILDIYYSYKTSSGQNSISERYSKGGINKLSFSKFTINEPVYISLCDCQWINITAENDDFSIGYQTREVI